MSNAAAAPAQPSLAEKRAEALEKFARIQHQVFFDVLASRGYASDTPEKQAELLDSGRLVAAGTERLRRSKQAAASSLVKTANAALAKQLGVATAETPAAGREKLAAEVDGLARHLLTQGFGETVREMGGAQ